MLFGQITIIGVGLIGGSIARSLKKQKQCEKIVGYARKEKELQKAVDLNVIDAYSLNLKDAIAGSELIVLASPVGTFESIFSTIKDNLPQEIVITDAGSSKQSVVAAAKQGLGYIPEGLVPGHPIAGTEKSGVEASFDSLFENRCTIITPLESTSRDAVEKVRAMWESMGAEVVEMTPEHHDHVLAATSHLPHVLAFSLVDTLAHMHEHIEIFRFAAGGFRDFTRIASSDPIMWRDICVENKDAILEVLKIYEKQLKVLEAAIDSGDANKIQDIFVNARDARNTHVIQ